MGKRIPIPARHPGTPDQKLGAKYDPKCANRVIGEATFSGRPGCGGSERAMTATSRPTSPTSALRCPPLSLRRPPCLPPEGHVGVYVHGGKTLVGHVVRGSQATAARFGSHFAKLGEVRWARCLDWQDARLVSQQSTMNASRKGATNVKIGDNKMAKDALGHGSEKRGGVGIGPTNKAAIKHFLDALKTRDRADYTPRRCRVGRHRASDD